MRNFCLSIDRRELGGSSTANQFKAVDATVGAKCQQQQPNEIALLPEEGGR
jgi:hypothetical protein